MVDKSRHLMSEGLRPCFVCTVLIRNMRSFHINYRYSIGQMTLGFITVAMLFKLVLGFLKIRIPLKRIDLAATRSLRTIEKSPMVNWSKENCTEVSQKVTVMRVSFEPFLRWRSLDGMRRSLVKMLVTLIFWCSMFGWH